MDPLDFLAELQSEAQRGFHKDFGWVDDTSSIAKALTALAERAA